jgi:hypothetical protein
MYLLIMIALLGKYAVGMEYAYFEDEASCQRAAQQFGAHADKDMKLKAFCVQGYRGD